MPSSTQHTHIRKTAACFAPLGGVLFGLLIGWFLAIYFHNQHLSGFDQGLYDAAVRFFSFALGVNFWAMGVVFIQRRQLHCGGSREIDESDKDKNRSLAYLIVLQTWLLILAIVILYLGGNFVWLYFALLFISLCVYAGEIGYGDPFYVLYVDLLRR